MTTITYGTIIKQAGIGRALSRIIQKATKPIANWMDKDWNAYVKELEKLGNRFPKDPVTKQLTPEGLRLFKEALLAGRKAKGIPVKTPAESKLDKERLLKILHSAKPKS